MPSYQPDTDTLRGDWPQIESTGNVMTIPDRERGAVRAIRRQLARLGQQLLILGERDAAEHVQDAIGAISPTDGRRK